MELKIPSKFEDLFFDESGEYGFNVTLDDAPTDRDLQLSESLSDFVDTCKSISHSQLTNGVINQYIFTLIKNFDSLPGDCKASLIDDLSELVKLTLDEVSGGKQLTDSAKTNGKKVLFYFAQLVIKAEEALSSGNGTEKATKSKSTKKKASGEFDWPQELRKKCLVTFKDIITSEIGQLWTMGLIEEKFLKSIWSYCVDLLVNRPAGISGNGSIESSSRNLAIQIVGSIVRHFGSVSTSGSYCSLSTALLDGIIRTEHMATYVGDICHQEKVLSGQAGHAQSIAMTVELVAEISKMNLGLVSAQGVKNISSFVEAYAKADPESFSLFIPTMIKQVDSPAHQMRSSMIQAMGHVIEYIREVISTPPPSGEESSNSHMSQNNRHALLRQRDDLLNILVERTHDINPYTRASLLKVWASLVDSNAVPVKRMGSIAEVALDRLFDKNSFVRRSSLVLFTSLVDGNPFTGKLDMAIFEQQRNDLEKLIEIRLQELSETMASKLAAEAEKAELRKQRIAAGGDKEKGAGEAEEEEEEETLDEDELFADAEADEIMVDLRAKHDYVSSATEFMKAIATALPRIADMLESKNISDVIEALSFFGRAINFQVHGALEEFKNAFKLIWHNDATVRQELQTVFIQVYFTDGAKEHARLLSSKEVAMNLAHVIATCNEIHLTSLEEILAEISSQSSLAGFSSIPLEEWFDALLNLGLNPPTSNLHASNITVSYMSAAIHAISMMTIRTHEQHYEALAQFVPRLLSAGLGEETLNRKDLDTIRATIMTVTRTYKLLQKKLLQEQDRKGSSPITLSPALLHDALISMQKVVTWAAFLTNESMVQVWFSVCEEAIQAIFQLHETPELVMDRIIHYVHGQLFAVEDMAQSAEEEPASRSAQCTQSQLAAFLFILGQTAINTVVYVEDIAAKVKRRLRENIEAGKPATNAHKPAEGAENNISDFEEQMGVAAAMDAEHDQDVHTLIEKELVLSNLLGEYFPLVTYVVANDQRLFSAPVLHDTSVLTLCRYATISSVVCEQSLPLIFTILERHASNCGLRTTITVALGDLAFRFPNTFEPWTNHLYARLRDDDADVRYNTLVVITHLVLNDMIKVKGQVSHVAMALNDTENRIRDLARLFFIKLSERSNNPIFNLLGDIISHFSRDEEMEDANAVDSQLKSTLVMPTLSEEAFQQTMHFLLSFVQKEKHADMLLERLLIRLGSAETIRQRRYLSYCISELTVTEKGLKKLVEMIKSIKVALLDEDVFQHFRTMLARAKKSRAPGASATAAAGEEAAGATGSSAASAGAAVSSVVSKSLVEEVEKALLAAIAGNDGEGGGFTIRDTAEGADAEEGNGADGDSASVKKTIAPTKKAGKTTKSATSKGGKKSGAKGSKSKRGAKSYDSGSDDEEEEGDDEEDDDEEEEEEDEGRKSKGKAVAKVASTSSRRGRQIQVDDEDD